MNPFEGAEVLDGANGPRVAKLVEDGEVVMAAGFALSWWPRDEEERMAAMTHAMGYFAIGQEQKGFTAPHGWLFLALEPLVDDWRQWLSTEEVRQLEEQVAAGPPESCVYVVLAIVLGAPSNI